MRHKHFKIKLFFVQLIAIIPLLLFIFYLFDLWFDARRSQLIEQNIYEAKQTALYIEKLLEHGLNVASILTKDQYFSKLLTNDEKTAFSVLKNIVENSPYIHNIVALNKKGKILVASFELTPEQKKMAADDRDYFQKVLQTKKPVISEVLTGRLTQKEIVILSSPVLLNNEVEAVVNVSFNLEKTKENLENLPPPNGKILILLDKNDQLAFLISKNSYEIKDKFIFSNSPLLAKIKEEKVVFIDNQHFPILNKSVLGAAVISDKLGWKIISVQPSEEIFSPILKAERALWLILGSSFLFACTLITFFLRKVKIIF